MVYITIMISVELEIAFVIALMLLLTGNKKK
jgi:hypothetical protein